MMAREHFEYMLTPDGGRIRYRFWPSTCAVAPKASVKTILLMQGRASFMEKFSKIIETLQGKGYHVWSFDWRGQGLSSRMTKNRHKGHIDSYETYLQDLRQLLHLIILPHVHGPFYILGQSMGSHLALRFLAESPGIFDGAFLTAPMLELNTGGYTPSLAQKIVNAGCKLGLGTSFVPGHGSYNPAKEPFEGNLLTHDRKSFLTHRELQKKNPDLSVGGVTFGWVKATLASMETLNHPEVLARIQVPVFAILAGDEGVVDNTNAQEILSWLPEGGFKVYEGARHQLLSESVCYMRRFWEDFDAFMERCSKKNALPKGRLVESPQLARVQRIYPTLPNDFQGRQTHP